MSAVNAAEILQKLVTKNMTLSRAEEYLKRFVSDIPPFDLEQAALTATMHAQTREFGLSLGDRACLALGMQLGLPVLTADQVWVETWSRYCHRINSRESFLKSHSKQSV